MLENDVKNLQNRLKALEEGISKEPKGKSSEFMKVKSSGN